MNNLHEKAQNQGLRYQYFIDEAESIVRELKKPNYADLLYLAEKLANVVKVLSL